MPVTVAVLGAGSLIAQGIIKALRRSALEARIVGLDAFPTAVGLFWCDASHMLPDVLSPDVREDDYLEALAHALRDEGTQVLLPATDFAVPWLARHRERLETASGCRVVVSSPEVAEIADDKWATVQFLRRHGFGAPRSLIDLGRLEAFIEEVGLPVIVKPRRGARSRGVTLVRDRRALVDALRGAGPDPIVQEALGSEETEYTAGAVVADGECLGVIVMRRDLRDGNTYRAYLQPQPDLEEFVRQAALALQPVGPANFQLRVGPTGPVVFEINARFSGTTIIRTLAGFNEVEAVVNWMVFGTKKPLVRTRDGVALRYWEELFLSWDEFRDRRSVHRS